MNGDWVAWGGNANGNSPGDYIPAWRHIHDIFVEEGATNVKWVWAPNRDSNHVSAQATFDTYYPGDAYVDYIGMNGYNWGTVIDTPEWVSVWQDLAEVFGYSYDVAVANADKPIIISETASTEVGGNKAEWITDAFAQLPTRFPEVESLTWFNMNKETDWRVESSTVSLDAFRDAIATLDDHAYYFTWYDSMNGDWVMITNPGDRAVTAEIYLGNHSGYPYPNDVVVVQPGQSTNWQPAQTTVTGPVKVVATNGDPLIVSQRVLYKNSMNEVAAVDGDKLDSKYHYPWYDDHYFADWVLVANPDNVNSVYYEISIGGSVRDSGTLVAGGTTSLPRLSIYGGPVVVEAWTDAGKTAPANIVSSQRVLYYPDSPAGSFSEVQGTADSQLSSHYYWPSYDSVHASEWVMVANPNSYSIYYRISVAGTLKDSGTIPAGQLVTPQLAGTNAAPAEVQTWTDASMTTPADSVASMRIVRNTYSFEEIPGYAAEQLSSHYYWTWYDQLSGGVYDWITMVNLETTAPTTAEVWVGGALDAVINLPYRQAVYYYHPGLMSGPVEIKAYRTVGSWDNPDHRVDIVTSQSVLWNNYYNELMGTSID